jgi:AcrR family transcriptional regulator
MQDSISLGRKERERLQRKKEILKAAANLFSKKGYNNTTLEEIAVSAEFGIGTIYNYFANKEEIIRSILECIIDDTLQLLETSAAESTFKNFMEEYTNKLIEYFLNNSAELLIIVNHYTAIEIMPHFKEKFQPKHDRAEVILKQKILQGIKNKEIRKDVNPDYLLYLLDGSIYTYTTMIIKHAALTRDNFLSHIKFVQDILFNGILTK